MEKEEVLTLIEMNIMTFTLWFLNYISVYRIALLIKGKGIELPGCGQTSENSVRPCVI